MVTWNMGKKQALVTALNSTVGAENVLLDEPMSNLDVALRVKMREEIRAIQQETGITTLFITHDQQEALSISDRIAVMRDGVVLQAGTPEQIYNHPSCDFVANFVGTTNAVFGGRYRPEQLRLIDPDQEGAQGGITVRIEHARFVGPYYEYTVRDCADGSAYQVLEVNEGDGSARSIGTRCVLTAKADLPAAASPEAADDLPAAAGLEAAVGSGTTANLPTGADPDAQEGHLR